LMVRWGADNTPPRENSKATNVTQMYSMERLFGTTQTYENLLRVAPVFIGQVRSSVRFFWEYRSIGTKVALNQHHQKI